MATLGIGTRVMLIDTDGCMPPLGARGVIVSDADDMGDFDVLFHGYPCPVPPDTSWVAHWTWLLPLEDGGTDDFQQSTSNPSGLHDITKTSAP